MSPPAGAKPTPARSANLPLATRFCVYQRGAGYVGFGHVTHKATPLHEARRRDGRPLIDAAGLPDRNRPDADPANWEYAVGVEWVKTVPLDDAEWFTGAFANQNVVCKFRHERTLKFLRERFDQGPPR